MTHNLDEGLDKKVLIADMCDDTYDMLKRSMSDYSVDRATSIEELEDMSSDVSDAVIICDVMLGENDTIGFVRSYVKCHDSPVVLYSDRTDEYTEIAATDAGAFYFVNKPVRPRAMRKRIDYLFRKYITKEPETLEDGFVLTKCPSIQFDNRRRVIRVGDTEFDTVPKISYDLIRYMSNNPDRCISRDEILKNVWGDDVCVETRTVDVHMHKVRSMLGRDSIQTRKGIGYMMRSI